MLTKSYPNTPQQAFLFKLLTNTYKNVNNQAFKE
jgi:hypothetical protein